MINSDYIVRTVATVLSSLDDYLRAVINTTEIDISSYKKMLEVLSVIQYGCIKIDDIMRSEKNENHQQKDR